MVLQIIAILATPLSFAAPAQDGNALYSFSGPQEIVERGGDKLVGRPIVVNPGAILSPTMSVDLFDGSRLAVRDRVEETRDARVWVGHLQGDSADTVIVTQRGGAVFVMIQSGADTYETFIGRGGRSLLVRLDLDRLPPEDGSGPLPQGFGASADKLGQDSVGVAVTNTVQDLLIVYTQGTCNWFGSCPQAEAALTTAVAEMNTAYAASQIALTMNLVGLSQVTYSDTNTGSQALSDLRGTTDGQIDGVHALRTQVGADLVALVAQVTDVCGIGYLSASASYAFTVTDPSCAVGNRTLAHEIGHNQGAHHDRVTVGTTSTTTYNYGFRRCNDTSVDNLGSPYFRTILAYSCSGSPRVGHFSNPNVNYAGVPTGVDPLIDPARAAFNARTLNESAAYVAGFRAAVPVNPPGAPTGLVWTNRSYDSLSLSWADNSTTENEFVLERSVDNGLNWSTRATLQQNTTSYVDSGLMADTQYGYRVSAQNSAGRSAPSNELFVSTEALPQTIVSTAGSDVFGSGQVVGTYVATQADGGATQTITEVATGSRRNRQQGYAHGWNISFPAGVGGSTVTVDAAVSGAEGAVFSYGLNGGALQPMFVVEATTSGPLVFALPGGAAGTLRIQVADAEKVGGEAVDSVIVDYIAVTTSNIAPVPPPAPSNLTITTAGPYSVAGTFQDNSANENGFEIRRASSFVTCTGGSVVATRSASAGTGGTVVFEDLTAQPGTTYAYWATAVNVAGSSGCSNPATVTTPAAPAISLSASGIKDKGFQIVTLTWSGATTSNVDVFRNGVKVVAATPNDGHYVDNLGVKGTATYVYRVCEAGSTTTCSNDATVVF